MPVRESLTCKPELLRYILHFLQNVCIIFIIRKYIFVIFLLFSPFVAASQNCKAIVIGFVSDFLFSLNKFTDQEALLQC